MQMKTEQDKTLFKMAVYSRSSIQNTNNNK